MNVKKTVAPGSTMWKINHLRGTKQSALGTVIGKNVGLEAQVVEIGIAGGGGELICNSQGSSPLFL